MRENEGIYGVPENEGMEEPLFNPHVQMNSDALAVYLTRALIRGGLVTEADAERVYDLLGNVLADEEDKGTIEINGFP